MISVDGGVGTGVSRQRLQGQTSDPDHQLLLVGQTMEGDEDEDPGELGQRVHSVRPKQTRPAQGCLEWRKISSSVYTVHWIHGQICWRPEPCTCHWRWRRLRVPSQRRKFQRIKNLKLIRLSPKVNGRQSPQLLGASPMELSSSLGPGGRLFLYIYTRIGLKLCFLTKLIVRPAQSCPEPAQYLCCYRPRLPRNIP